MAESLPDPTAAFRDLVSQWEKGMNESANRWMQSSDFAQTMHKMTSSFASMQQQLGDTFGRFLSAMNLPTRTEMTAIGERLQSIEASLRQMSLQMEKLGAPGAAVADRGPPRTKQPPAKQPQAEQPQAEQPQAGHQSGSPS